MKRVSLSGALAALCLAAGTPVHAQIATTLPKAMVATRRRRLRTMPHAERPHGGPGRPGRMEEARLQHGAARRTIDAARGRHRHAISRHHFGPGAPAAPSAALPNGPGKELVETRCAVCHTLERVTIIKRQKRDWDMIVANMYERWGQSAPDEVQAISAYLVAQFGHN